jgi:hypothetical protein
MPRSLAVTLAAAGTIVLLAGAVFWAGDRETVVPPPEAVGEQLLRQLHAHREVRTQQLLAESVRSEWPPQRLRDWWYKIEQQVGDIRQITGDRNTIDGDRAVAWVDVEGRRSSSVVEMQMHRQQGLWVVAQFPPKIE